MTLTVSGAPATASGTTSGVLAPLSTSTLLLVEGVNPGHSDLDGVDADRQIQEVRLPLRVGHLRLGERAGELHVGAGHPRAGRILNRDVDASGEYLRARRRREAEREHQCRRSSGRPGPTRHVQQSSTCCP